MLLRCLRQYQDILLANKDETSKCQDVVLDNVACQILNFPRLRHSVCYYTGLSPISSFSFAHTGQKTRNDAENKGSASFSVL
jgi:hypothetical protein